jgi:hypothetical protein
MIRRTAIAHTLLLAGLALLVASGPAVAQMIVDGDFSQCKSGKMLRNDAKGQDWYESRKDTKAGRKLLMLSTKDVGGNKTAKAMIKANPDLNTYLTQRLASGQAGDFTVQYDVYVREILPDDNHSAFFLAGDDSDGKRGPNSTGAERFVFLGFENAKEKGKINLFAREGSTKWEEKTVVASGLDLNKWYTIVAAIHVQDGVYEVSVKGVTEKPVLLDALKTAGKTPKRITHLSFASWNDGAGTFYVDNVSAVKN